MFPTYTEINFETKIRHLLVLTMENQSDIALQLEFDDDDSFDDDDHINGLDPEEWFEPEIDDGCYVLMICR